MHDPGFDLHQQPQQQQRGPLLHPPQANAVLHEQQHLPPLHLLPEKRQQPPPSYHAPDPNALPQALPVLGQPMPGQPRPPFMNWPQPQNQPIRRKKRNISLKEAKEVKIKRELARKMLEEIAQKVR